MIGGVFLLWPYTPNLHFIMNNHAILPIHFLYRRGSMYWKLYTGSDVSPASSVAT